MIINIINIIIFYIFIIPATYGSAKEQPLMSQDEPVDIKKFPGRTLRCENGKLSETEQNDQVIELLF